jgi:hypothetical protein
VTMAPGCDGLPTECLLFVHPLRQFSAEFGSRKSRQLASAIESSSGPKGVVGHGVLSEVQTNASDSRSLAIFSKTYYNRAAN